MKFLKTAGIILLFLVAVFLIAAAIVPKEYTITVSETIKKPKSEVYDYLKMFRNQKEYSEWIKPDPAMTPIITGTDGAVGAVQNWNSTNNDVGEGSQTIKAMDENKIDIDIKFKRPMEGAASVSNVFEAVDSTTTKLTVNFYTKDPYPLNLPSYLFGRPMIEKTEVQILKNIKEVLEKK